MCVCVCVCVCVYSYSCVCVCARARVCVCVYHHTPSDIIVSNTCLPVKNSEKSEPGIITI